METQSASKDYRKMIFVFLMIILLGAGGIIAWEVYKEWSLPQRAAELQKKIDELQEQERQRLMADTYGGTTPQETLRMYIEAVERGDYELASKYFIEEKRILALKELNLIEQKGNKNLFLFDLKEAEKENGSYSFDTNNFTVRKPILVDFTMYPNGIWKIIEI